MENFNKLRDLNERLSCFEDEITYQKADILKIEKFISECLPCLENQKAALRRFIETKKILEEEKAEYLKKLSQEIINENIMANNRGSKDHGSVNNDKFLNSTVNETINSGPISQESYESNNGNKELLTGTNSENIESPNPSKNSIDIQFPASEIKIPGMEMKCINCVTSLPTTSGIFIGGSNGTLLRYDPPCALRIFETSADDDIISIEMLKEDHELFLICFTNKKCLVFNVDSTSPKDVFEISGFRYSFKVSRIIYAVLLDGSVKRFCFKTWKLVDEESTGDRKCHCFYTYCKFSLASFLNDSTLYRFIPDVQYGSSTPIPTVKGAQKIWYVGTSNYLCNSDNCCWLFNENLDILGSKVFENGIKHIGVSCNILIVCDFKNTIYEYSMNRGTFSQIRLARHFELDVTAVANLYDQMCVACSGRLFSISRRKNGGRKRKIKTKKRCKSGKKTKEIPQLCTTIENKGDLLDIGAINGRIVHKMCLYKNDICIAGSEGMLLRHCQTITHTYDTGTKADILQIEILKFKARVSLIAFTKTSIIIFEDIDEYVCHEEIIVPEVGIVFNASCALFIPLANGSVKKLDNQDLRLKDHGLFRSGSLICYVTSQCDNTYALTTLPDLRLYKIDKSNSGSVTLVPGPEGVIGLRRLGHKNFLCYSDTKIWTLNAKFSIIYTTNCKGVRLLDVSDDCIGFIDSMNTLFVHGIIDKGNFGARIFMTSIDGPPTALSTRNTHVYVSIGNTIHIYRISLE